MTSRINTKWRWLVALGAVFVPAVVTGAVTVPHTFSSGTPIHAAEVNENFEALRAKLDALSGQGPVAPPVVVGSLTLTDLGSIPILRFGQSVTIPVSLGGTTAGKPSFSDIELVKELDSTSPILNLRLNQGFHIKDGLITMGSFAVRLSDVVITSMSAAGQGEHPLETLSLTFASIEWSGLGHTSSYDRARAIGGGANPGSLAFAFFGAGATPDPELLPILEYSHTMSMPCDPFASAGCKVTHLPLSLFRVADGATIDNLGLAVLGRHLSNLDMQWRTTGTTIDSRVRLNNVAVASVGLSTRGDGSLVETVDFAYAQIQWSVGSVTSGWDLAANRPL